MHQHERASPPQRHDANQGNTLFRRMSDVDLASMAANAVKNDLVGNKRLRRRSDAFIALRRAQAIEHAFIVLGLDALAGSLGMAILAFYVTDGLGGSASSVGALLATFAGCNMLASMWIGFVSDRVGRRQVMLLSVAGVAMGFFACAFAPSLPWLFAARAWVGICAGVGSTARAYVAEVTPDSERTSTLGRMTGVGLIAYSLGAPLGSLIALLPGGYRLPYFVAGVGATLLLPYISVRLPSTDSIRGEIERKANKDQLDAADAAAAADRISINMDMGQSDDSFSFKSVATSDEHEHENEEEAQEEAEKDKEEEKEKEEEEES